MVTAHCVPLAKGRSQSTEVSCSYFNGWRRGSVVRMLVTGRRTFPALRPIYGWKETTLWVNCPPWVCQPG